MKDKICLITGANSGIGKVTARELAKKGAHIIMLCRNEQKAENAREDILRVCGHDKVDIVLADLSSTKQIKEAAAKIRSEYPRIDVLINNAGMIMGNDRETTEDGFEWTFGVNHLAPFLLTHLLIDKVLASKKGNIITVSSEAHRFANFDLNDLQMQRKYNGLKAYANSKLCNILFTHELAKRLKGTQTVSNTLHPGAIASNFGKGVSGFFGFVMKLSRPFMISEEKGAETTIYLASSEEGYTANGLYFKNKKPASPTKVATNDYNARRLWEVSEELLQVKFSPVKHKAAEG
ncbi:SDR family oxidoreductase [Porifericola rhodea]|uniref:SDR family oxidoreductase n=1 Tax=Porifericola rhodea TaxID=930972 RepID=UPI0026671BC4|nr:SDR family oxidoreductase [Porifericola rhodea]WKN32271.1 SDR family oxidoreductase [Porifericola rhodea]